MRFVFSLLLVLTCSCNTKQSTTNNEDSLKLNSLQELYSIKRSYDSIKTSDSIVSKQLVSKKQAIDSLINLSLDIKQNQLDVMFIKTKVEEIKKEKQFYKQKVEEVEKINNEIKEQLQNTIHSNEILKIKNDSLSRTIRKVSEIDPVGIKVIGIGNTKSLFSKGKEFFTNKVGEVKTIRCLMTLPKNDLIKNKQQFYISMKIFSAVGNSSLSKDTNVVYDGSEKELMLDITRNDFVSGNHKITVYVNTHSVKSLNFKIE